MNEERRVKFRKWFYNALLPCGSPTCHVRIAGTILHLDSLLERFMPPLNSPTTIVEGLKQYTNDVRPWKAIRYKAHNEDFTEILWKEQYSKERLKAIQNDYVLQGFPEGYAQEYLNYPLDETTAFFRKGDFKPLREYNGPENFYISADLAISEKKQRAFSVFCVASMLPDSTLRYKKVLQFRGDALVIIDYLFELVNLFKPEIVFVEKENIANSLESIIYKEMEERNVFFRMELLTPTKDKMSRARPLQARMRAGKVEFDMEADWFPSFQQELMQFPRGAFKDQVDSASWIPLGINKVIESPTLKEYQDELYEDEKEDSYDLYSLGANMFTGY